MSGLRDLMRRRWWEHLDAGDHAAAAGIGEVQGLARYAEGHEGPVDDRRLRSFALAVAEHKEGYADLYANAGDLKNEAHEWRGAAAIREVLAEDGDS